jgi:ATP-dependent Lon protease
MNTKKEKPVFQGLNTDEVESILHGLKDSKSGSLRQVIADIQELISLRDELHQEMLNDIEKIKTFINTTAIQINDQTQPELAFELKKNQIDIDKFKIEEKLNRWRDVAALKKELRERVKEITEREQREAMLNEILKE